MEVYKKCGGLCQSGGSRTPLQRLLQCHVRDYWFVRWPNRQSKFRKIVSSQLDFLRVWESLQVWNWRKMGTDKKILRSSITVVSNVHFRTQARWWADDLNPRNGGIEARDRSGAQNISEGAFWAGQIPSQSQPVAIAGDYMEFYRHYALSLKTLFQESLQVWIYHAATTACL